ncbi:MAG: GatB/YqeY domain-containing protein [Clostridiales bacterium]|nr:GatB/YqeY domain-containing protein [Clostridiales bacterium]
MGLKRRLMDDLKTAMKERDVIRKNTITMVRAAILQREKDEKVVLDDEGVISILSSEMKKREASLKAAKEAKRPDLIEEIQKEIQVLQGYLPRQLTREEIHDLVLETIKEVDAKSMRDMGRVMGVLMPKVKGRADGKIINQVVRDNLQ